jgi:hypothetical protein
MLRIKLVTGDTWGPARAVDYSIDTTGGLALYDEAHTIFASVAPEQWIHVELIEETDGA